MRLFIAINFTEQTTTQLAILRDELRKKSFSGKFSANENLHLTLAFLGECNAKQTVDVKAAIEKIQYDPFYLYVDCIGRFKRDDGDIWWAGVRGNKTLMNLQHELTENLIAAGFTLEKRKYRPHITLGREVVTNTEHFEIEPFGEKIYHIDLMKSERIGGKLTYTSIYRRGK